MPWTSPETFTAGQTLTSASMNIVSANARMGGPVFTNEAARDAAITSPEEGMTAYLTAPTVPAATGATTAVPTGVQTIYNGSVWVCITPIGAYTTDSGTRTANTYGTLTGGGTNPSVTLATGATALVSFTTRSKNSNLGNVTAASVAVSGATTLAGSDDYATFFEEFVAGYQNTQTSMFVLTGLTGGTNTFTLNYRVDANTGTWTHRRLVVQGIA